MPTAELSLSDDQLQRLGLRIVAARQERGLTREALSQATQVSLATLARMESGHGGVGLRHLMAVADYLGLPVLAASPANPPAVDLPLHPLHVDDEPVQEALEEAARLACERLDRLFPGAKPESRGISSNFQGLLVHHLAAMLSGEPAAAERPRLTPLVYTDDLLGREYRLKEGAAGFLVRWEGTERVLEEGRFRLARSATDLYTSWPAAAQAVRDYLHREGHLPGPVKIISGWWSEGGAGVRFTPPVAGDPSEPSPPAA